MRLVLFDIDGTLIHSSCIGRKMVTQALMDVFSTAGPVGQLSFAGKTDQAIILELMAAEGKSRSEINLKLPDIYDQMVVQARILFPGAELKACPGINDLLKQLDNNRSVVLGIQTGNIKATAALKLQAASINPELFLIGAYGSDAIVRSNLIPIAWTRAQGLTGISFTGMDTLVIGDTPADIECAKINGAISVAVATGSYNRANLAKSEPNFLLDNLVELPLALTDLFN